ncbi:MAG: hypothetical protein ACK4SZ_11130 [Allosphingosinicella sp.]
MREPVLSRAFDSWKAIDPDVGAPIEARVRAGAAPQPAEGMGEALFPAAAFLRGEHRQSGLRTSASVVRRAL